MAHRHTANESYEHVWTYCIDPMHHSDERAHGNITRHEICRCGAERDVEINARAHNSPWYMPDKN